MNTKSNHLATDSNALFNHDAFNLRMRQTSQPDMQGTLICKKVNHSLEIHITNVNGPRVARLFGRDYAADESIPMEQLLTTVIPQWNEFTPIFDVLENGNNSPFWDEVFETTLQQPIQIINPITQESHIGEINLQLCSSNFQLGQSYQLDVSFKHYKIHGHLDKQTTSIHDLNGVLRTSLTLLNDLQQNQQDDNNLKKQKIDSIIEVINGGLTICPPVRRSFLEKTTVKKNAGLIKSNSLAFFQNNDAPIDIIPRQLSPEHHVSLRELLTRCTNGFIILADDLLVNLKILAKKLYVYLTQNNECRPPFTQSNWGNDVILMDEVNFYGIIFVANGTLADEIIQQYPVRVLITDNDMPNGLSGVDLITAIRERDHQIKIALHTAIEFDHTDTFISTHTFTYIIKGRHDLLVQFITEALPLSEREHAIIHENQGVKLVS